MVTLASTHRAKAHAHIPDVISPTRHEGLDVLRPGIRRQVDVVDDPPAISTHEDIPDRPAHEGQLMTRVDETGREGSEDVRNAE